MMLRMRAVDMVVDAGYTPLEALDAAEAVAILESRSDVALMCTDIQMPGQMDGVGLAHAVHERWPRIRIIVTAPRLLRYADTTTSNGIVGMTRNTFVRKLTSSSTQPPA